MPKVSVVIPCYNHGKYLDEAVNSVMNQTYQDFEIVIVNDGSTDKFTNELLFNYSKPKTKVIFRQNRGVALARNMAIEEAVGEYILPLDADDRIAPRYLQRALEIFESKEGANIGIIYCLAEFFAKKKGLWRMADFSLEKFLLHNTIFCSAFFRKSDWNKVGGYKACMNYGYEDWDFWLSLLELGIEVYRIPEVMFHYRIKRKSLEKMMGESEKLAMRERIFLNHQKLYRDNMHLIFKYIDFDNVKSSVSYKLASKIARRFPDFFVPKTE